MSIQPRCEKCGAAFDPLTGGICSSCGRLLCGRHLRGWLRSLLPALGTERPVCVDCREGRRPLHPQPGAAEKDSRGSLWMLMLVAAVGLVPLPRAHAQSFADSVGVMRAIGAAVRNEARQVLSGCWSPHDPCPPALRSPRDSLVAELARAADVTLILSRSEAFPPCAWGADPTKRDPGFRVATREPRFDVSGDTVHVVVMQSCDNPHRTIRRKFAQDFEYRLTRQQDGAWRVLDRRLIRIT